MNMPQMNLILMAVAISANPIIRAQMQARADYETAIIGLRALTGATCEQIIRFAGARRMSIEYLRQEIAAGRISFEEVTGDGRPIRKGAR